MRTALKGGAKWYHKPINWILILICIIVPFPLYRFIKKQMAKNSEQDVQLEKDKSFIENQNPIVQTQKAKKITTRTDIQAAAKDLAHHLGTKYSDTNHWYSFLDPRGWTENDKKVADILIKQRLNFKLLERLYYSCYTNSRSLSDDVLKLLDEDELKRVQKYLKI
ncbi:hypothetical protein ACSVH2_12580 [Flavobacterium sp. RSB2_4_14]|uniref:hypothetical protein n=1 Tax=Flavobacterium sp. RSB2_4_14 TaxID=3447665 RepID=UPI003F2D8F5C